MSDHLVVFVDHLACHVPVDSEKDSVSNLETPGAYSSSLKCVHHWCDEKGDITCEICLSEVAGQYGTPLEFCDPRLLAIAEAERQFLDVEYDEYAASNVRGVAFFRSTTLIPNSYCLVQLMALLLLLRAFSVSNGDNSNDDPSNFFSLFLLHAARFLLPCYIMAWAISILQHRQQRQVSLHYSY
ncbi:hypothetical protein GYH30_039659 [Glycine max]|uniref:RING-CH-type domain-containing protein n=2 Tax=Glycine subgen. Soja TaxID=1462606 RepID=K7M648_SOYBN|nr:hypothetical protein JHK87_039447 [Glycine soja]KAH1094018.1 hypothetical protein GYH30_039659 [Glycine max]RZB68525.1 hypothetical protein D0Y65_038347 [Glycine soja]